MDYELEHVASGILLRIRGEARTFPGLQAALFPILLVLSYFAWGSGEEVRALAYATGSLWGLYRALEFEYGVSQLMLPHESLIISRTLFGFGRKQRFPRQDVERVGYLPGEQDHPALGLMVRTHMWPLRIGCGMSKEEAAEILDQIRNGGSWLASKTRSADMPLF